MLRILSSGAATINTETGCTLAGVPADISTIDITDLATIVEVQLSDRDPQQLHILNRVAKGLFKLRQAWMHRSRDSI